DVRRPRRADDLAGVVDAVRLGPCRLIRRNERANVSEAAARDRQEPMVIVLPVWDDLTPADDVALVIHRLAGGVGSRGERAEIAAAAAREGPAECVGRAVRR